MNNHKWKVAEYLDKSECSGNIKEEIELDKEFGFIVGAYLAEGHCTNTNY